MVCCDRCCLDLRYPNSQPKTGLFAAIKKHIKGATTHERCWPPSNSENDKKVGVRFDWSGFVEKDGKQYRKIVAQFNKDAYNHTIANAASRSKSHLIHAELLFPVTQNKELDTQTCSVEGFNDEVAEELSQGL